MTDLYDGQPLGIIGAGDGVLGAVVWPVYVGYGSHPDEDLPVEARFQIRWGDEGGGLIVGHADPLTAGGEYGFLLYFHAPSGPPTFAAKFDHPVKLQPGRHHIGPIIYQGSEITAEVP